MERNIESQIFRIIDEMDNYIAGCKPKVFSNTEIVVDRQTMEEYLRELRRKAPEEIEKYRKIIKSSDAIINDAREKAQALIDEATVRTDEMMSQNQIMQRAYERADEIVAMANDQAQSIVDNAVIEYNNLTGAANAYMEDIMNYLEGLLGASTKTATQHYEGLIASLQEYADRVHRDHQQLHPENAPAPAAEEITRADAPQEE